MTRLLSTSEFGLLSVVISFAGMLSVIFGLGTQVALSRYFYEDKDDLSEFIGSNFCYIWTIGLVTAFIMLNFKHDIAPFLGIPSNTILYILLIAFGSASFAIFESLQQVKKNSTLLSKISVVKASLSLIFTIGLTSYLESEKYLGNLYSLSAISVLFFVYILYSLRNHIVLGFSRPHIKYSILVGGPIVFHILSTHLINTFDHIMINKIVGPNDAGMYAFAYKFGMIFQLLVLGLTQSWSPIFFENMKSSDFHSIDKLAKKFSYIVSAFAVIVVLLSPLVATFLAPPEFHAGLSIVPIVISGMLFQFLYTLYIGYAFYAKKTASIALITLVCAAFNVGSNYLLIPIYGYKVAAWTTFITYVLFFLTHYLNVRLFIRPERIFNLNLVLGPVLFSVAAIFINTWILN
jgi:O-antigen/teichoic acid export membrane protein